MRLTDGKVAVLLMVWKQCIRQLQGRRNKGTRLALQLVTTHNVPDMLVKDSSDLCTLISCDPVLLLSIKIYLALSVFQ